MTARERLNEMTRKHQAAMKAEIAKTGKFAPGSISGKNSIGRKILRAEMKKVPAWVKTEIKG